MSGSEHLGAPGIGLTVVFGIFLLMLLLELYYIFFWKTSSETSSTRASSGFLGYYLHSSNTNTITSNSNSTTTIAAINGFSSSFSSSSSSSLRHHQSSFYDDADGIRSTLAPSVHSVEFVTKLLSMEDPVMAIDIREGGREEEEEDDYDDDGGGEMAMESCGHLGSRRLLFTIKEETKEDMAMDMDTDMESDDGARMSSCKANSDGGRRSQAMDAHHVHLSCSSSPSSSSSFSAETSPLSPFATPSPSPFLSAIDGGGDRGTYSCNTSSLAASPIQKPILTEIESSPAIASSSSSSPSSSYNLEAPVFSPQRRSPLSGRPGRPVGRVPLKYLFERSPLHQISSNSCSSGGAKDKGNIFNVIHNPLSFHQDYGDGGSGATFVASPTVLRRAPLGLLFQQSSPIFEPSSTHPYE